MRLGKPLTLLLVPTFPSLRLRITLTLRNLHQKCYGTEYISLTLLTCFYRDDIALSHSLGGNPFCRAIYYIACYNRASDLSFLQQRREQYYCNLLTPYPALSHLTPAPAKDTNTTGKPFFILKAGTPLNLTFSSASAILLVLTIPTSNHSLLRWGLGYDSDRCRLHSKQTVKGHLSLRRSDGSTVQNPEGVSCEDLPRVPDVCTITGWADFSSIVLAS